MRNRRQVPTSDDEDDVLQPRNSTVGVRKRKKFHLPPDEEEDDDGDKMMEQYSKKKKNKSEMPDPDPESDTEEQEVEAQPVGEPIRFSGKGRGRRSHFDCFEYDGIQYQLVSLLFSFLGFSLQIALLSVFASYFLLLIEKLARIQFTGLG